MPRIILDERDLTGLATEEYVRKKVAEAQLGGSGSSLVIDDETLKFEEGMLSVNVEAVISAIPTYSGSSSVDPTFEAQTLQTAQTYVENDITVNSIRVATMANESGTTVYIGMEGD